MVAPGTSIRVKSLRSNGTSEMFNLNLLLEIIFGKAVLTKRVY